MYILCLSRPMSMCMSMSMFMHIYPWIRTVTTFKYTDFYFRLPPERFSLARPAI